MRLGLMKGWGVGSEDIVGWEKGVLGVQRGSMEVIVASLPAFLIMVDQIDMGDFRMEKSEEAWTICGGNSRRA